MNASARSSITANFIYPKRSLSDSLGSRDPNLINLVI